MTDAHPVLSLQERDRRWKRVRELMRTKGLDCLVIAGLRGREQLQGYITNAYDESVVVFPYSGEPICIGFNRHLHARIYDKGRRGEKPWVTETVSGLGGTGAEITFALRERLFHHASIGVVGLDSRSPGQAEGHIPYRTWAHVLAGLPNATFVDITSAFQEMVLVKSEEELALIRYSAAAGEAACQAMMEITRPSVSEAKIFAHCIEAIFERGCYVAWRPMNLQTGTDNWTWSPPMWLYESMTPREVQKGDMVQTEFFPRYGGFETQQQMSIALGPVPAEFKECAAAARQAYEVGMNALRSGKTFEQVAEAMEAPIAEAGCWHLSPLIHSLNPLCCTGRHEVGVDKLDWMKEFHSKASTVRGGDVVIQPGMVFEFEPNASKGKQRINIGGTVIVTEDGVEELNKLPTEMRIID